ncbi:hypothetical protein ACVWWQ_002102 [Rhodanobacter sp. TND4EL1]
MRPVARKWGYLCAVTLSVAALPVMTLAQTLAPASASTTASAPASASSVVADIPFVSADAANFQVPSAPDAWGGPRGDHPATLSDQVVSYTIEATLDPTTHTVDAKQTMTWRNRSNQPVSKIYLHLYLNAFEGPGSTFFTERRMFSGSGHSRGNASLKKGEWGYIELHKVQQGGQDVSWRFVHPDGGPKTDHTVVELDLPQAVPAQGTLSLDIDFHDQLPRVVERTGWFGDFHLVGQWFPKIAVLELAGERGATAPRWNAHEFHFQSEFYADYGNYDVKLTVPKGYTVGAVGEEQGTPVPDGDKVTHHFVQTDVEDFAWVAAPGYKVQHTTWNGPGSPKVDVQVIYPPEYEASAQPVLKASTDSLTYFSDTLGPYPYRTVTAVVPPYNADEAGGMEYPTFFTAEGYNKITPDTLSQYGIDFVTIHEFGHGYFMGILGSNEFEEPMLDEGMNEYWDDRMLVDRKQDIWSTTPLLSWLGIAPRLNPFEAERNFGVAFIDTPSDSLDSNSWDRMSSNSYGSVYSRTAAAMRTLENLLGREAMGRAMKLYYERWKFRHPDAADLRDALAEGSGKPELVNAIFASQVYGTDKVDASVVSIENEEQVPRTGTDLRDGKRITLIAKDVDKQIDDARAAWKKSNKDAKYGGPYPWLSTITVRRTGAALPRTVLIKFADDSSETVQWADASRWKRITFTKPVKAVSATVDPGQKILLDTNTFNDSRTIKADGTASRRWSADVASFFQTVYALMGTL